MLLASGLIERKKRRTKMKNMIPFRRSLIDAILHRFNSHALLGLEIANVVYLLEPFLLCSFSRFSICCRILREKRSYQSAEAQN